MGYLEGPVIHATMGIKYDDGLRPESLDGVLYDGRGVRSFFIVGGQNRTLFYW